MKHETALIIESNESLAENKTKNKTEQLLSKYKHGNDIHEHRKQQKMILTKWLLLCFRCSRLYRVHHKKHETSTAISPILVCINRINSRLVFKIKDGYTLELQMPETMKVFGSTKTLIGKTKNV